MDATRNGATGKIGELHQISCPYCQVGHALVTITRHGTELQIEGIKDPRKCTTCGKMFMLKPTLKIEGRRMED